MEVSVTQHVRLNPEPEMEGVSLEFRLVYQGPLPSSNGSKTHVVWKHQIRREIHKQLKAYWSIHPELRSRLDSDAPDVRNPGFIEREARKYQIGNNFFLPLMTEEHGLSCALDILFLRRDSPGKVVTNGGDIDNRLKTLFDAFRVPEIAAHLPTGWTPEADEVPLYCLLSDDSLITTLSVTTDRLLTPLLQGQAPNDVLLTIQVRALIMNFSKTPAGFIAN